MFAPARRSGAAPSSSGLVLIVAGFVVRWGPQSAGRPATTKRTHDAAQNSAGVCPRTGPRSGFKVMCARPSGDALLGSDVRHLTCRSASRLLNAGLAMGRTTTIRSATYSGSPARSRTPAALPSGRTRPNGHGHSAASGSGARNLRMVHRRAAVHDHRETSLARDLRRLPVDDAELQPQREAPVATALRATSTACSGRRNTSTMSKRPPSRTASSSVP